MKEDVLQDIFENTKAYFDEIKFAENLSQTNFDFREDNPIRNIIVLFLWNDLLNPGNRTKYDGDAYYYKTKRNMPNNQALHGDTLISFFTPYSACVFKETEKKFVKSKSDDMLKLLEYIDKPDEKLKKVNNQFREFAKLYYTKGNFILLPNRQMNNARGKMEDRVDETVFHCYKDGKLSKFFDNDDKVKEWLEDQKLNVSLLFNSTNARDGIVPTGDLIKENVKLLIHLENHEKNQSVGEFYLKNQSHFKYNNPKIDIKEIYDYIDTATQIIEKRNLLLEHREP